MSPLSNSSDGEDGSEQEMGFDPAALSELSEAGDSVKSADLGTMLCKSSSEDDTHNPRLINLHSVFCNLLPKLIFTRYRI